MGWIFVDKDDEGGKEQMRSQMRRSMRGGYRYSGSGAGSYRDGYREGYKHGWEDHENGGEGEETEEGFRRSRDSHGRFM